MKQLLRKTMVWAWRRATDRPPSLSDCPVAGACPPADQPGLPRELPMHERGVLGTTPWPDGRQAAFNFNLDDLCPAWSEEPGTDFGGKVGYGINRVLDALLEEFPFLKMTHFVIPKANPRFFGARMPRDFDAGITAPAHARWLDWTKERAHSGRMELAAHGLEHFNAQYPVARHAEFAWAGRMEARNRLVRAAILFGEAGIAPAGFRPPGWGLSADYSLLEEVAGAGFRYIAASSLDGGLNVFTQRVSNHFPALFHGILNIPQNIELGWPYEKLRGAVEQEAARGGIVSLKAHCTDNPGICNSLTPGNIEKLRSLLRWVHTVYGDGLWYATMDEIARLWKQRAGAAQTSKEALSEGKLP